MTPLVDVLPHRLMETVAMLPILHGKQGPLTVAVAGSMADVMAVEALKWRDVQRLLTLAPLPTKDRRIEVVQALPAKQVDVMLLSPDQRPDQWWAALSQDGIMAASTTDAAIWPKLLDDFRCQLGRVTPWRGYLPKPIYGTLGRNAALKPVRNRQPPKGASHLTAQFLPSLFTFAKDELPIAFTRSCVRLANHPGSEYDLVPNGAATQNRM